VTCTGKATQLASILPRRSPKQVGALEAAGIWFALVMVSIPWLSFILFLSFLKSRRSKTISMTNSWANFVLKKVGLRGISTLDNQILKVNLIVEDRHDYGSPPYIFVLLNQYSLLESLLILPAVLPPTTEVFTFANIEFLMIPFLGMG
jgi:hypothetical protein